MELMQEQFQPKLKLGFKQKTEWNRDSKETLLRSWLEKGEEAGAEDPRSVKDDVLLLL